VGTATLKLHPGGKATEVQLRSNVPPFEGAPPRAADAGCRLSPSLMMSALQKAVRRGLVEPALRIAAELWARDPLVALRRAIIISVEDALPHPALPLITWLMLAASIKAPAYGLGPHAAAAYLGVVRDLARCGAREGGALIAGGGARPWLAGLRGGGGEAGEAGGGDGAPPWAALPAPARGTEGAAGGLLLTHAQLDALGEGPACVVRALLARALYGGMHGDVAMLKAAALLWALRFAHDASAREAAAAGGGGGAGGAGADEGAPTTQRWSAVLAAQAPPPGAGGGWAAHLASLHGAKPAFCSFRGPFPQLRAVARLGAADVPLSAVDYHVSDIVDDVLHSGAPAVEAALRELEAGGVARDAAAGAVKECMWELRSAVNGRPPVRGGAGETWAPTPHVRRAWAILEPVFDAWAGDLLRKRF
jgi:hypothetical protein